MHAEGGMGGAGTPPSDRRVLAMGLLLLLGAGVVLARAAWRARVAELPPLIVEVQGAVQGEVPRPGLVTVPSPGRAHDALRAAGVDPEGMLDATLAPGTRLVVGGGAWRAEPMDAALAAGLPVDLNLATVEALQALPGVGPTRAEAIVAERARGGPFVDVDDLDRVPGIGPATVEKLRPYVVAGR